MGQELCHAEILQVFVVGDDVHGVSGTFKIMAPGLEGFKNSQELLVMGIIIEFQRSQHPQAKSDWSDLFVCTVDGEDPRNRIVGRISFHNYWSIRDPMCEDRSGGEGGLEALEGRATVIREDPRDPFPGEAG